MISITAVAQLIGHGTAPFTPVQWVNWGVVVLACCLATSVDVRCRRIPNKLTGPMMLTGIIWWLCVGGIGGLGDSLGGMGMASLMFASPTPPPPNSSNRKD